MAEITYLEAIREALVEEMERDERLLPRRRHRRVRRRVQGHRRAARPVRRGARHRHADLRDRASSARRRARRTWACGRWSRCSSSTSSRTRTTCSRTTSRRRAIAPFCRVRWSCAGPSGGYVRGGPFHSQNPEAGFIHTPGLKVVYPGDGERREGADEGRDPRRRSACSSSSTSICIAASRERCRRATTSCRSATTGARA